jgi:hypothetical protein
MTLTHEQVAHFRQVGYFRIDNVIEDELVDELLTCVAGECPHLNSKVTAISATKQYRMYEQHNPTMSRLVEHPNVMAAISSILGPNVVFVTNRHNQSAMNYAEEVDTRLHRDILHWSRNVITVIAYLSDANEQNGCTHVIPGSQHLPLVGVPQESGGGTWMEAHEEFVGLLDQAVPVPVRKGGILIFDGLLFHSAGKNRTQLPRPAVVLGYRSVDELDANPDPSTQIVVAGRQIYRGNDRPADTFTIIPDSGSSAPAAAS